MVEAKVHYREPGTPWAWCSASIHGKHVTTRPWEVTCLKCKAKGRPRYTVRDRLRFRK